VFPSDLPGVNPATLNGMLLYYRLMTKWSGLGDSTELSRVGLSQLPARHPATTQDKQPKEQQSVKSVANQVLDLIGHDMAAGLGTNPSKELFCFVTYVATMLALRMQDDEMLSWDKFKLYYDAMYPEG
jgi:hypothetical protein